MKRNHFIRLLVLGAATILTLQVQAQVQVRVNGSYLGNLDTIGGLYFANDTLEVRPAAGQTYLFPLDSVSVITFQVPTTEGVVQAQSSQLRVTPVPTRDYVTLQGIGSTPQQVTLYNTTGQPLLSQLAADGSRLDLRALSSGLYLLRCGSQTIKIVKQ